MAGFSNNTMYADNVAFDGGKAPTVNTNGQLLIGSTAAPNIRVGTLASAGGTVVITNGAGTINLEAGATTPTTFTTDAGSASPAANVINIVGGSGIDTTGGGNTVTVSVEGDVAQSFPTNSGTAIPALGALTVSGTGSTTTTGAGSTVTVALTGLTNHAVLIGAGTATITKVGPVAATGAVLQSNGLGSDPGFSTATYPSIATGTGTILRADGTNWVATTATYPATTTINQLLYSSSANVVAGLAAANSATLVSTSAGVPVWSGTLTNGQVILGSTGATPAAGTITSTSGTITVTTGAGSLNLEVANGGFTWTDVTTATQALAVQNGYMTDRGAGVTYTLPASGILGNEIRIVGKLGLTTIAQNANQQILFGSASSTIGVGGSITGTNVGDCMTLICITPGASTVWRISDAVGNLTVT